MNNFKLYYRGLIAIFPLSVVPVIGSATVINVVHYNIRELDSTKIRAGLDHEQLRKAVQVSQKFTWHLFSVNEMQYDMPSVPDSSYQSSGENMHNLMRLISGKESSLFSYAFGPANTGLLAKQKKDGSYEVNTHAKRVMELADKVNFGIFSGQYSSGAASRFPIESTKIISSIPWKVFNSKLDLSQYRDSDGNKFPANKQLFDKNFTDAVVNVKGKKVHFILLHAVPAHHFGNPKSPNNKRNHDQLAFLEWYLSGKSSVFSGKELRWKNSKNEKVVKPIAKDATFVAVGDWNVDIRDDKKPGSMVLRSLYKKFKPWKEWGNNFITYESSSFAPKGWTAQLDYILLSNDIEVVEGGVHSPTANRKELGCGGSVLLPEALPVGRVVRSYSKKERGAQVKCWVEVNEAYALSKEASDHKPIWAKIKL